MQRIHIPVFLQLDIPTTWDKTQMYDTLDEMRLNGTPEMNIRIKAISRDDLSILAELTKKVLCNVEKLQSEIDKLMSTLLSEATIDTTEPVEIAVKLSVLESSGKFKFF